MIDASDLRQEFKKIRAICGGKKPDKEKAMGMFQELQNAVINDIMKTGDQRVRNLLKMVMDFSQEINHD